MDIVAIQKLKLLDIVRNIKVPDVAQMDDQCEPHPLVKLIVATRMMKLLIA
jgi:hypothetical protein